MRSEQAVAIPVWQHRAAVWVGRAVVLASVWSFVAIPLHIGAPVLVKHVDMAFDFVGIPAGHTFFHVDPHGLASICKVGRDDQISLLDEGAAGLARMGAIANALLLRTGGCSGCTLSGSCTVCRPLAKLYQDARAPLSYYCQHGRNQD